MSLKDKITNLRSIIKSQESAVVAFSGGVDSTFLSVVAHEVLKDKMLAVTALSSTYPQRERERAVNLARQNNMPHLIITSEETEIENFCENSTDRCYFCKSELFEKLKEAARKNGLKHVFDGSNADDEKDYRPGMRAVKEMGIKSPLKEAGLTKDDIRTLSHEMGLETWNLPPMACLASRFPYGESITAEKLGKVEKAEAFLADNGLKMVRVRFMGDTAKIETDADSMAKFMDASFRKEVAA
ncbi:MAG: ATP-dependent sacrificial sulfur transferase LarE, partial [bacterium]